jgi:hypothetical protein
VSLSSANWYAIYPVVLLRIWSGIRPFPHVRLLKLVFSHLGCSHTRSCERLGLLVCDLNSHITQREFIEVCVNAFRPSSAPTAHTFGGHIRRIGNRHPALLRQVGSLNSPERASRRNSGRNDRDAAR